MADACLAHEAGPLRLLRRPLGERVGERDLHRPLGYTLDCAATNGVCTPAPHGLDASAVVFDSAGQATFWLLQDFGLDAVAVLDADGALLERYDTTTYGHRRVLDANGAVVCNAALEAGCGSQVGNPLGHAGAMWSSVAGVYEIATEHRCRRHRRAGR